MVREFLPDRRKWSDYEVFGKMDFSGPPGNLPFSYILVWNALEMISRAFLFFLTSFIRFIYFKAVTGVIVPVGLIVNTHHLRRNE